MKVSWAGILIICLFFVGCFHSNDSSNDDSSDDDSGQKMDQALVPVSISLQSNRLKVQTGFNEVRNSLIEDSFNMLTSSENMLKSMNDSKDILINMMTTLGQAFELTTSEPLTVNSGVDAVTPPFSIGLAGLSDDFILLSSNSRFFIKKNTMKTRFKTPDELTSAWIRAVEYSDQTCVYVSLQSVDGNGVVSSVSNTLIVPLIAADQCSV